MFTPFRLFLPQSQFLNMRKGGGGKVEKAEANLLHNPNRRNPCRVEMVKNPPSTTGLPRVPDEGRDGKLIVTAWAGVELAKTNIPKIPKVINRLRIPLLRIVCFTRFIYLPPFSYKLL